MFGTNVSVAVAKVTQGVSPGGNSENLRLCLLLARAERFLGHAQILARSGRWLMDSASSCVLPNQREEKCQQQMLDLDKLKGYTDVIWFGLENVEIKRGTENVS
jgi:hypothetical protein